MTSKDFDWVMSRYTCNIAMFFQEIRDLAQQSVNTRNSLSKFGCFQLVKKDKTFKVNRAGTESVSFRQDGMRICVNGYFHTGEREYSTRIGKSGECELIDSEGEKVEPWEVLSRSLDALFFDVETDHPRT